MPTCHKQQINIIIIQSIDIQKQAYIREQITALKHNLYYHPRMEHHNLNV